MNAYLEDQEEDCGDSKWTLHKETGSNIVICIFLYYDIVEVLFQTILTIIGHMIKIKKKLQEKFQKPIKYGSNSD